MDAGTDHRAHLVREAATMGLYVSVCLLAVLVAHHDGSATTSEGVALVWGTTMGLSLAHWFAFRVSSRLVGGGTLTDLDARIAGAQLGAAATVAAIATVPILFLPAEAELDAARLVISLTIAIVGYVTAEQAGASRRRAVIYATSVLVLATAIAAAKNGLAGH